MSKRKLQVVAFGVFVAAFVGALICTKSRPTKANVNVTFAGYTIARSPFSSRQTGFQPTNASFSVSNAGTAKVRLTLRDYEFKSGNHTMFMHSDLGILCSLKPGQSTNLIVPIVPNVIG